MAPRLLEVIPGATTDTYTPRQDNPETNDEEQDDNGYFLMRARLPTPT